MIIYFRRQNRQTHSHSQQQVRDNQTTAHSIIRNQVMPGKKRKAESNNSSSSSSMWGSGSSQSPSSSSRRSNKQSSSSRRGGGGGGGAQGGSGAYPYINEESASKLFDEICDEDDPNVAGMEGEFLVSLFYFVTIAIYH